jgi:hypothetical protein
VHRTVHSWEVFLPNATRISTIGDIILRYNPIDSLFSVLRLFVSRHEMDGQDWLTGEGCHTRRKHGSHGLRSYQSGPDVVW